MSDFYVPDMSAEENLWAGPSFIHNSNNEATALKHELYDPVAYDVWEESDTWEEADHDGYYDEGQSDGRYSAAGPGVSGNFAEDSTPDELSGFWQPNRLY